MVRMRLHAKFLVLILGGLVLFIGILSFHRITRELAVFLIALIALIGGVLYLAVRKVMLRPLKTLSEGAVRLDRGDFTDRIAIATGDEFEDLARTFNVMAGRLKECNEFKELQAKLLNRERFAAMGQVVAGVAHEIRNPLFGISSVGQILERELVAPQHQELVRALLTETRRMNQLVEELLVYGRPMHLTLERCDLAKIWEEVIGQHRGELDQKGIRIGGDSRFVAVEAMLDSGQIRQVFLNLLRNAIDATYPGGEIAVRLLLEDRYLVVKIADTGIGIPLQNLGKIFDLFFTTKPKGTGLGLAICKKIVQDHGGDIMIESEEGKGTTATIKLPYGGAEAGAT
jgi:signal transduction histidine kinase